MSGLPCSASRVNGCPPQPPAAAWHSRSHAPHSVPLAADNGSLLTLQGSGAYDAAVHCASVSAARRLTSPGVSRTASAAEGASGPGLGRLCCAARVSGVTGLGNRAEAGRPARAAPSNMLPSLRQVARPLRPPRLCSIICNAEYAASLPATPPAAAPLGGAAAASPESGSSAEAGSPDGLGNMAGKRRLSGGLRRLRSALQEFASALSNNAAGAGPSGSANGSVGMRP